MRLVSKQGSIEKKDLNLTRLCRWATVAGVMLFALALPAFADNVGFCPPPATAMACSTANGLSNETIKVGTTGFGMWSLGSNDANSPWYLLVAVPVAAGGSATAPTITSGSFTQQGSTSSAIAFQQTTTGDIYDLPGVIAITGLAGPGSSNDSMNAANMFCDGGTIPCANSNEIQAFGSLPSFFDIFVYTFNPGFNGSTPYSFSSSPMVGGTYLAAIGAGDNGKQFSTPFTTTGLVQTPRTVPTPEPDTLVLLTSGLIGLAGLVRRKRIGT